LAAQPAALTVLVSLIGVVVMATKTAKMERENQLLINIVGLMASYGTTIFVEDTLYFLEKKRVIWL